MPATPRASCAAPRRAPTNEIGSRVPSAAWWEAQSALVSAAQGLEIMRKRYPELVRNLTSNPLGDALTVTPNKAEDVDKLFNFRDVDGSAKKD